MSCKLLKDLMASVHFNVTQLLNTQTKKNKAHKWTLLSRNTQFHNNRFNPLQMRSNVTNYDYSFKHMIYIHMYRVQCTKKDCSIFQSRAFIRLSSYYKKYWEFVCHFLI